MYRVPQWLLLFKNRLLRHLIMFQPWLKISYTVKGKHDLDLRQDWMDRQPHGKFMYRGQTALGFSQVRIENRNDQFC